VIRPLLADLEQQVVCQEEMVDAEGKLSCFKTPKTVLHGKVQQAIGEYLKIIKVDPNDVLY
jgi:hypothetical protein